jgi:hypothetical protein
MPFLDHPAVALWPESKMSRLPRYTGRPSTWSYLMAVALGATFETALLTLMLVELDDDHYDTVYCRTHVRTMEN